MMKTEDYSDIQESLGARGVVEYSTNCVDLTARVKAGPLTAYFKFVRKSAIPVFCDKSILCCMYKK